ncbi:methyltransferase domain-containing protein [Roseisolibacter sp. H3M3-2]|uniref:spermine/spermidine synthase domain-containing protein n=1 Tax=Roseisolibacter sp. H3M3-2 TaxID=3031323 RepID=UPI0023DBBB76|nr:methyltransferase domain-containing protein [Roseisolibacter sp. H3M3-2]MDF1502330.1 methyltransferase domain-containing protein [Roseisolibacter sp. H3M3-2]
MSFRVAMLVAALSGFVSLSFEILWFRAFSFATGAMPWTFGRVLAAFLIGLAQGAAVSRRLVTAPRDADPARPLLVVAGAIGASTLAAYLVVPGLGWLAQYATWQLGFLLVVGAAFLLGVVLPVVSHLGIAPSEAVGSRLSWLYVANIVGSAAGSLLTGFVLSDVWPMVVISRALLLAGLASAALVALLALRLPGAARVRRAAASGALGAAVLATLFVAAEGPLFGRLWERLLYKREAGGKPAFAEVVETRAGVIPVTPRGEAYGGGAYDGIVSVDLRDDENLLVRAYALAALHPHPQRVLKVGLGTGAWARALLQLPGVDSLTAIEINPGYLPLIERHPAVRPVLHDPRATIVIDDGRRWITRHPEETFDAIVMNTTWHNRAHSTNLLSREFLQLVRSRLRPGGVMLFNTTWSPDAMRTATEVFPHTLRIVNVVAASDRPLAFDTARWEALLRGLRHDDGRPVFPPGDAAAAARLDTLLALPRTLDGPPRGYGLESGASLARRVAGARVVTDDNMRVEWRASAPTPLP